MASGSGRTLFFHLFFYYGFHIKKIMYICKINKNNDIAVIQCIAVIVVLLGYKNNKLSIK